MFVIWMLANVVIQHEAPLRLTTQSPAADVAACIKSKWNKMHVEEGGLAPRKDLFVSYPAIFHVLDDPKPFWIFHIDDLVASRTLSVGYNFGNSPKAAEKQLRKMAAECAEDATELPTALTP